MKEIEILLLFSYQLKKTLVTKTSYIYQMSEIIVSTILECFKKCLNKCDEDKRVFTNVGFTLHRPQERGIYTASRGGGEDCN